VSYPNESPEAASQPASSVQSIQDESSTPNVKPKTNRYRTQSSSFNNQQAQASATMPAHVVSPYVTRQHTQAAPSPVREPQQPPVINPEQRAAEQMTAMNTMPNAAQHSLMISDNQSNFLSDEPSVSDASPHQMASYNPEDIALDGHCPVILDQKRWEPGSSEWAVRHRGKIYYCSTKEARDAFLAEPDRYSPMLSGYDVVRFLEGGQIVAGKREFGCWFGGRVFLFDSEETRRVFDLNVNRYLQQLNQLQASADEAESAQNEATYR
jgi:YHS domain-containing protein